MSPTRSASSPFPTSLASISAPDVSRQATHVPCSAQRMPTSWRKLVVSKGLSVRATEQLAKRKTGNEGGKGPTEPRARPDQPEDDPDILALESSITENTGLKARIKTIGAEAGTLTIHYRTLEQTRSSSGATDRSDRQPLTFRQKT